MTNSKVQQSKRWIQNVHKMKFRRRKGSIVIETDVYYDGNFWVFGDCLRLQSRRTTSNFKKCTKYDIFIENIWAEMLTNTGNGVFRVSSIRIVDGKSIRIQFICN